MGSLKLRLPLRQASSYFRILSSTLESGLSVTESCELVLSTTMNPRLKRLTDELLRAVMSGGMVSSVFSANAKLLPPGVTAIIEAGETTGNLPDAFRWVAEVFEFKQTIRTRIINALIYPILIVFLGIIIAPVPALFLTGISAYLHQLLFPAAFIVCVTGAGFLISFLRRSSESFVSGIDRFCLGLPVIGKLIKSISIAWFSRILAILLRAGIDAISAMQTAVRAVGNSVLRQKIARAVPGVIRGGSISSELERTGVFPHVFLNLLKTGEHTGNLDDMLDRIDKLLQEDIMTSIRRFLVLLGPVVFLVIAVYFAWQIIGFWRNYFGMIDQLTR